MATHLPVQDALLSSARKPEAEPALVVETIDSIETFLKLEPAWKALYELDSESGYFLSWGWISNVFRRNRDRIRILAVRNVGKNTGYVAFFPITSRIRWSSSKQSFQGILEPGGRVALSELTGFLCHPDEEKRQLPRLPTASVRCPGHGFPCVTNPPGAEASSF
ncbi:MAG: hypothetical protein GKR97_02425 [Rhizobiaceae bacterium]|nr:hypothetical protein [Rhizobiaceae bacterium]